MPKPFLLLLFFLHLFNARGQDIDSLRQVAAQLRHDTDRVNLFCRQGFAYRSADAQYSYDCAREAERYAQRASQPYYAAKAFNLLGVLYYRRGNLGTAVSYHKKALELRSLVHDRAGIAMSQTNLGNAFSEMGLHKQAEKAYLTALELNADLGGQKQAGNCLLNLGVLAAELNQPATAENYFNLALANARLRFDYELQASCYNNLAETHLMAKNYDAAIANCMNSLKIKELMDNGMEQADSYLTLSKACFHKRDPAPGRQYLHMADSIIAKFDYLSARLQALLQHADYEEQDRQFEAAYSYLKNYRHLKDSLEVADRMAQMATGFIEQVPAGRQEQKHTFPYLYFWLLVLAMAASVGFVLANKR